MEKRRCLILRSLLLTLVVLSWGIDQGQAAPVLNPAVDLSKPNFAYSPPLRKFIDSLPGLGAGARPAGSALGASTLGQYIPIAHRTATPAGVLRMMIITKSLWSSITSRCIGTFPRSPGLGRIRPAAPNCGVMCRKSTAYYLSAPPHYLGPLILATKNRPVRIKFTNLLPRTAAGGNLFLPVDTTIMGAGKGPLFADGTPCDPATQACASYTQNRATIHLHGGLPPWISDGTAHQWITPAGEDDPLPQRRQPAERPRHAACRPTGRRPFTGPTSRAAG